MSKYIEEREKRQENGYFVLSKGSVTVAVGSGWMENEKLRSRALVHRLHQASVDNHKWSLGSGKWCVNVRRH